MRRSSSRGGLGLPSPSEFQSGLLPRAVYSQPFSTDLEDSGSESGNAQTTDSESEAYGGGRYSLDSSPQDDRVPTSDYTDVTSSRESILPRRGFGPGKAGFPARALGFTEEEEEEEVVESDSAPSSEFSTTQAHGVGSCDIRRGGSVPLATGFAYPSRLNAESGAEKGSHPKSQQTEEFSDEEEEYDVPSAPPFCVSRPDIDRGAGKKTHVSRADISSCKGDSDGTSARTASTTFNTVANPENKNGTGTQTAPQFFRATDPTTSSNSYPVRLPTFNASTQGPWLAMIGYDACVRVCLQAWAKGCMEAPMFLENECTLLREVFGLRQVLLQSEDELLARQSSGLASEAAPPKPKNLIGKMKVQARKVKMAIDPPTGCSSQSLKAIKLESFQHGCSNLQSAVSYGRKALRKRCVLPCIPANGSFSRHSLRYMHASTQYIKQVSGLLKTGVTTLRSSSLSYEDVQETYFCLVRLKSSAEEDVIRLQFGSNETHVFFPGGLGDDLIVEVQDSKGKKYGRAIVQVASIVEDPSDKLRWWSIYHEPEHELVGKIQLHVNYSTSLDENSHLKYGSVAETVAYDLVLEVAMKVQHFQQRRLLLHGEWRWLLNEFASYYGVSDAYTKLRYLSYIMDVATPTADCLALIYDLLFPIVMEGQGKSTLSHQENRILGDIKDQTEQILALVFENYKSLDESVPSGIVEVFRPSPGLVAPALEPAIKLYSLLHDILSPEAQSNLVHHFQVAAKKRSRRHLAETDEFATNNEGYLMDPVTITTAYQKMKSLCENIRNEIFTDIEIHNQHILPSFIDLPNLSSSIYGTELCSRLRGFLIACPPSGPASPVADLVVATANFQKDLADWNIKPVRGAVDAKELFHLYIMLWIQDKRLCLLESSKMDKIMWSGIRTQNSTTPFVDDMYKRLIETMNDYEVIICRWPEYTCVLENAMADVEKATVEALDRQYLEVLVPLKENLAPKKFGFKYVQKLTKRTVSTYLAPDELGILLNTMKRMLDVLCPKVQSKLKSWGSCVPDGANFVPGERLSEVTVMLRTKFRNYMQAVVEKLAENSKLQNSTKLKKILHDSKQTAVESEVRGRMLPLIEQLKNTINHLHTTFETHVFITLCRGYWDRMGQEILDFLENRKDNRSWYKGSQVAATILDDTFASQMQQLLGNALHDKDLEPPRSIAEIRSMLGKDVFNQKDNSHYY